MDRLPLNPYRRQQFVRTHIHKLGSQAGLEVLINPPDEALERPNYVVVRTATRWLGKGAIVKAAHAINDQIVRDANERDEREGRGSRLTPGAKATHRRIAEEERRQLDGEDF